MAGIDPFALAGSHTVYGSVPLITPIQRTVSGTTTYNIWDSANGCPFKDGFAVSRFRGIMRGAGGGGMTIQLFRVVSGTATAITDLIDLSGLADQDTFEEARINDAQMGINYGEGLRIVTAGNALTYAWVEGIKV